MRLEVLSYLDAFENFNRCDFPKSHNRLAIKLGLEPKSPNSQSSVLNPLDLSQVTTRKWRNVLQMKCSRFQMIPQETVVGSPPQMLIDDMGICKGCAIVWKGPDWPISYVCLLLLFWISDIAALHRWHIGIAQDFYNVKIWSPFTWYSKMADLI